MLYVIVRVHLKGCMGNTLVVDSDPCLVHFFQVSLQ